MSLLPHHYITMIIIPSYCSLAQTIDVMQTVRGKICSSGKLCFIAIQNTNVLHCLTQMGLLTSK